MWIVSEGGFLYRCFENMRLRLSLTHCREISWDHWEDLKLVKLFLNNVKVKAKWTFMESEDSDVQSGTILEHTSGCHTCYTLAWVCWGSHSMAKADSSSTAFMHSSELKKQNKTKQTLQNEFKICLDPLQEIGGEVHWVAPNSLHSSQTWQIL